MSDPCEHVASSLEAALHDDRTAEDGPPPPDGLEHATSCARCAAFLRLEVRIVAALRHPARSSPPLHALPEGAISSIVAAMVASIADRPTSRASAG